MEAGKTNGTSTRRGRSLTIGQASRNGGEERQLPKLDNFLTRVTTYGRPKSGCDSSDGVDENLQTNGTLSQASVVQSKVPKDDSKPPLADGVDENFQTNGTLSQASVVQSKVPKDDSKPPLADGVDENLQTNGTLSQASVVQSKVPKDDSKPPLADGVDENLQTNGTLSQTSGVQSKVPKDDSRPPLANHPSSHLTLKEKIFSWRYLIVFLLHFSFVVQIGIRNCMPMALICMVDSKAQDQAPNGSDVIGNSDFRVRNASINGSGSPSQFEFDWDNELQGLLLTSVSFLSLLGPMVTDVTRRYLGNKWTMTIMSVLAALLTFLAPEAARLSPYLLLSVRTLSGIVVVANLPITGDTCAWWGPAEEKQIMISIIFSGVNIGGIVSSSLTGLLCQIPYDNGWPFVFYFFGGLTLLWTLAWHFLSSQKPEEHPFASDKEKDYIVRHRVGMTTKKNVKTEKPPYLTILTSVPVLAFLYSGSSHVWTSLVFFTNLPFFFVSALGFSVVQTGLLISVISLVRFAGLGVWTTIINQLSKNKKLTITTIRKITISTGFGLAGLTQIVIVFLDRDQKWLIFALLLFVMINQCVGSCVIPVIPLDLAPKYAGFLTGLFFSLGCGLSVSGPLIVSALTPTGTIDEWRNVWIIFSIIFLMSSLVFALFGDARLQPWAIEDPTKNSRVVSSFTNLGRRFSSLFHSSPLTPVTPVQGKTFDFTRVISPLHQLRLGDQLSYGDDVSHSSDHYKGIADVSHSSDHYKGIADVSHSSDLDRRVADHVDVHASVSLDGHLPVVSLGSFSTGTPPTDLVGSHLDRGRNDIDGAMPPGGYLNQAFDAESEGLASADRAAPKTMLSDATIITRL